MMSKKIDFRDEKADRLSDLPESIRNHIVSFLPMKDAVRTSILSKQQWRNVCSSLPNLVFDERLFQENKHFIDFVDHIIDCRDGSSLRTFDVYMIKGDHKKVDSWISFSLQHDVKILDIRFQHDYFCAFPSCMFTCRTLTRLTLRRVRNLVLPEVIRFPVLRRLNLFFIEFSDDKQTIRLISSCPELKWLSICYCVWKDYDILTISAPKLQALALHETPLNCKIRVYSRELRSIFYRWATPDICIEDLSSLLSVNFEYFYDGDDFDDYSLGRTILDQNVIEQRVSKVLMGMKKVVQLKMNQYNLEILTRVRGLLSNKQTSFVRLKELRLKMFATGNQVEFVRSLLQFCPNLRTLCISFIGDHHSLGIDMGKDVADLKSYKKIAHLKHLKYVGVKDFKGTGIELYVVSHLLQNASILEKMNIAYSKDLDQVEKISIGDKLWQIQKASPVAILLFDHNKDMERGKAKLTADDIAAERRAKKCDSQMARGEGLRLQPSPESLLIYEDEAYATMLQQHLDNGYIPTPGNAQYPNPWTIRVTAPRCQ